ncbi:hypothetical protein [Streptomyces sp. NPDC017524]|uniref:hypothetical protein n=1 Tax=unclassified Streptomyces TaxID=2593676 RepID=UPI0037B3CABC
MMQDRTRIYLAHRQTYAAFLTATDAEARVAWHRWHGEYPDKANALAHTDTAYTNTQAQFNMIDLDGTPPVEEARALVECIRGMHIADDEPVGVWAQYTALRTAFIESARHRLADHL